MISDLLGNTVSGLIIRVLQTKHNSATFNRVTVLWFYYKTIVANKVYYKRQVYAARGSPFLTESLKR